MAANSSSTSSSPLAAATTIDLLRFSTAGSVDDGKSTLIGRMLYDSRSVYEDQIASVRGSGFNRSSGPLDFSLLTDGLRAEREQGITIDVAYRYFSTSRRRFIIADTPGHEQYTRNMATGASTADAALVLVDATQGMLVQSRRHLYIASLLGIRYIVAAINKMDLVGYDRHVFDRITGDFSTFARQLGIAIEQTCAVPVSALQGDNVVHRSLHMPWYQGPTLLDYLERVPVEQIASSGPLRFPVQYVIRPDSRFRGFAGQVVSGVLSPGLPVAALPSGLSSRVKSLVTFHGELDYAGPGTACTVTLEDQIDLGRGDLLARPAGLPQVSSVFRARLLWMHPSPSRPETFYFLKHTTRTVRARFNGAFRRVDVTTLERSSAASLAMNEIAECELETTQPLFFDPYCQNRTMGSFILIDPISNAPVA
ncbi:MAG: sulfate adenylyltransferase subunit 1, partial [Candidatus Angelobacter sp.]